MLPSSVLPILIIVAPAILRRKSSPPPVRICFAGVPQLPRGANSLNYNRPSIDKFIAELKDARLIK
jgi:hypothetical protein